MYFYDTFEGTSSYILVYLHFLLDWKVPWSVLFTLSFSQLCPDLSLWEGNHNLSVYSQILRCYIKKLLHSVSRCQILFAGLFFCVNHLTTVETHRPRRQPLCLRSLQVKRSEWFKTAIEDAAQWGIKSYRGGGETGRINIKNGEGRERRNAEEDERPVSRREHEWRCGEVRRVPAAASDDDLASCRWRYHTGTRDERRRGEEERGYHTFSPPIPKESEAISM